MVLLALMLASADPAAEPSKFPIVREIDKIGGGRSTLIGFNVDEKGKVFGCTVLQPSGSTFLDAKACETVIDKGRFRPAVNEKGKPVSVYGKSLRVRWNIEE